MLTNVSICTKYLERPLSDTGRRPLLNDLLLQLNSRNKIFNTYLLKQLELFIKTQFCTTNISSRNKAPRLFFRCRSSCYQCCIKLQCTQVKLQCRIFCTSYHVFMQSCNSHRENQVLFYTQWYFFRITRLMKIYYINII